MEQKSILISALSVGVGVGIGLASGQTVGKWGANAFSSNAVTAEKMEQEMLRQVVDGRESTVTFDKFPYYLRHPTTNPFLFLFLFIIISSTVVYFILYLCKVASFPEIMEIKLTCFNIY